MTDEIYELLNSNISFSVSREEIEEIINIAENLGYASDGYSNDPSSLFAFIDGYLAAK